MSITPDEGRTHWHGCEREHGHHACALAELDRLRASLAAWQDASQCGHPNPCTLGPLCPWCEIARLRAGLERARTALLDANSICRSAFAIAHRVAVEHGTADLGAFFGRFSERVHESLGRQHDAILATGGYPIIQPAARPGSRPRD